MQTYLTGNQEQQTEYGVESGQAGQYNDLGLDWGGGTWDNSMNNGQGGFGNVQYGLTPQQAAAQGLTFFGTNPYNSTQAEDLSELNLGEEMGEGIGTGVQNSIYNYNNS